MKFISLTILLIFMISTVSAEDTVRLHLRTIHYAGTHQGRCYVPKSEIIETKKGDKVFPQPKSSGSLDAMFYVDKIYGQDSIRIILDKYRLPYASDLDTCINFTDSNYVIITNEFISLKAARLYYTGTYLIKLDSDKQSYNTKDTGDFPRITNVTDQDDPMDWILHRKSEDSSYIYLWTEAFNEQWCYSKHGEYQKQYKNGNISESTNYSRGLKQGKHQQYYANGSLAVDGQFQNNVKSGEWFYYDSLGELESFGSFDKGNGFTWYTDSTLRSEEKMVNGKKDGVWKTWYKNGQLASEVTYNNGIKKGLEQEFYQNGSKKLIQYNTNDDFRFSTESTSWYENGNLKVTYTYDNFLLTKYYDNGLMKSRKILHFTCETEPWQEWYENGRLKEEYLPQCCSNYYLSKRWDDNGIIRYLSIKKEDRQDSIKTHWYENGTKQDEKIYSEADSLYIVKTWFENGHIKSWGYEKRDAKIGIWRYWDENGDLIKEETYQGVTVPQ